MPERVTLNMRNRSHAIRAEVEVPDGVVPEGVLLAMGTALGGWSFLVLDGRLCYVNNYLGKDRHVVGSGDPVPSGRHELAFTFVTSGDFRGTGRLLVDGKVVGEGEIPQVTPVRFSISGGGITCGWEQGPAVGEGYTAPFPFTATLRRVTVDVNGEPHRDPEAEFEAVMSEQ